MPALAKNSKMNTGTSLKLGTLSPGSATAMSEDAVLLSPVELVELLAGPNPSPYWCRARGPAFTLLVEEEKKLCSAKFTHLGLSTVSLHPMPGNLNRRHWERSTSSGKRTRCCQDCAGKFGQQPGGREVGGTEAAIPLQASVLQAGLPIPPGFSEEPLQEHTWMPAPFPSFPGLGSLR